MMYGSNDAYDASPVNKSAAPLPQVVAAVERTGLLVSDIEQAFDILSVRLNPVSRYASPPTSAAEGDSPFRAPLADAIESQNDRLLQLSARVRDALEALEV